MFRVFRVKALTDKGRLAIQHNADERDRMRSLEKAIMKRLFDIVISPDYDCIEFRGKTQVSLYVDSGVMRSKLEESMISEGCTLEDFEVMIE